MKVKLLNCMIAPLMFGNTSISWAESNDPHTHLFNGLNQARICHEDIRKDQEEILVHVSSHSYEQPVTKSLSKYSTSEALSPDRRVSIEMAQHEKSDKATVKADAYQELAHGGVLWINEDPVLGQAELTVSASSVVAFSDGKILNPVTFFIRNNYSAFIDKMELLIYRESDRDFVAPIATVPVSLDTVIEMQWDGQFLASNNYREGDKLIYIIRAYDKKGQWDETYPSQIQLVSSQEEQRNTRLLDEHLQRSCNKNMSVEDSLKQRLIDNVFSENGLRQQNISLNGSRVRVQGRNIALNSHLFINNQFYPVDREGKFVAEYLMPVGLHRFNIRVENHDEVTEKELSVDVTGKYFLGIAIADLTVQQQKLSASNEILSKYKEDDLLTDARLAFYIKSKLKSKYLLTGQADTTEKEISQLFKGFADSYPKDVFRRLDPSQYYPTYGDDSTTTRDIDTQGRMYLRVDWDKSHALWGNYFTHFLDTELAQYQRALYGGTLDWHRPRYTKFGDEKTRFQIFGSDANTAHGSTELLGTGGSLYYLHHTDILPGSEQVILEVRDKITGRIMSSQQLLRGSDYEINTFQGRLTVRRPLSQIASEITNSITKEQPLAGYAQHLIVDYEYTPKGLENQLTQGGRVKHWLNDFIGIGATYVNKENSGDDYNLKATDLVLKAGRGTYLRVEHGQSESTSAPIFYSDNGGLSFIQLNSNAPRQGKATFVETRINLNEQGLLSSEWTVGAWWKSLDAGYSSSRTNPYSLDVIEYGAEVAGEVTPEISLYAKHSRAERGQEMQEQKQITASWRILDDKTLTAEVKNIDEKKQIGNGEGTLAAIKYSQKLSPFFELYGTGQFTLENDGVYEKNNALTLGGHYLFSDRSSISASTTHGSRGNSATLNGEYQLRPEHSLYGVYTFTNYTSHYDGLFNPSNPAGWTLGQRWGISPKTNIYNESQYLKDTRSGNALVHTFGMDFYPKQNWSLGYALQNGELESTNGDVKRKAVSVYGGQTTAFTNWHSKIEWRKDTGSENRIQWVTTNTLRHKINESWRVAAKANFSETRDHLNSEVSAKFSESSLGFSYRPWNASRWSLYGRYSYVCDLSSLSQVGHDDTINTSFAYYNQKAHVRSIEGVYRWTHRFESAVKIADRAAKIKMGRDQGPWFDSNMFFSAIQGRYEVLGNWYAMAEYRCLNVQNGGDKKGTLVGVDKDINHKFRVGVGYNFTDFSGDLIRVDDYKNKGWFLNFVGYY